MQKSPLDSEFETVRERLQKRDQDIDIEFEGEVLRNLTESEEAAEKDLLERLAAAGIGHSITHGKRGGEPIEVSRQEIIRKESKAFIKQTLDALTLTRKANIQLMKRSSLSENQTSSENLAEGGHPSQPNQIIEPPMSESMKESMSRSSSNLVIEDEESEELETESSIENNVQLTKTPSRNCVVPKLALDNLHHQEQPQKSIASHINRRRSSARSPSYQRLLMQLQADACRKMQSLWKGHKTRLALQRSNAHLQVLELGIKIREWDTSRPETALCCKMTVWNLKSSEMVFVYHKNIHNIQSSSFRISKHLVIPGMDEDCVLGLMLFDPRPGGVLFEVNLVDIAHIKRSVAGIGATEIRVDCVKRGLASRMTKDLSVIASVKVQASSHTNTGWLWASNADARASQTSGRSRSPRLFSPLSPLSPRSPRNRGSLQSPTSPRSPFSPPFSPFSPSLSLAPPETIQKIHASVWSTVSSLVQNQWRRLTVGPVRVRPGLEQPALGQVKSAAPKQKESNPMPNLQTADLGVSEEYRDFVWECYWCALINGRLYMYETYGDLEPLYIIHVTKCKTASSTFSGDLDSPEFSMTAISTDDKPHAVVEPGRRYRRSKVKQHLREATSILFVTSSRPQTITWVAKLRAISQKSVN